MRLQLESSFLVTIYLDRKIAQSSGWSTRTQYSGINVKQAQYGPIFRCLRIAAMAESSEIGRSMHFEDGSSAQKEEWIK